MLNYDKEMFEVFRELAITDYNDLVVGQTYYTNTYPEKFVLKDLLTYNQSSMRNGHSKCIWSDPFKIGWILTEDGTTHSLNDKNIGASYNPWLVFDNECLAILCRKLLKVDFVEDEYDYAYSF